MRQVLYLFLGYLLVSLLAIGQQAVATVSENAVGSVVAVSGKVSAVSEGGFERKLAIKDPVFRQDIIRTGNGRIQLMFSDNTLITLGRQAEMIIAEYEWKEDEQTGAMKTRIKEGAFRVMGGAITRIAPKDFTTETPVATIGIRGSMYSGRATPESLTVVFQGGKGIEVTNAAGSVAIATPGFGTRVPGPGQPPTRPARFRAADLRDIDEGMEEGETAAEEEKTGEGQGEPEKEEEGDGSMSGETGTDSDSEGGSSTPSTENETDTAVSGGLAEGDTILTASTQDGFDSTSGTLALNTGSIITTAQQDTLTKETTESTTSTEPTEPTEPSEPTVQGSPGQFLSYQVDDNTSTVQSWSGTIQGEISGGLFTGTYTGAEGTASTATLELTASSADSAYDWVYYDYAAGADESSYWYDWYHYDSIGEFVTFDRFGYSYISDANLIYYHEVGYFGTPTATLPLTGTAVYTGPLYFIGSEEGSGYQMYDSMIMWVNFANRTFMGYLNESRQEDEYLDGGIFYGRISDTGLTDFYFLGGGKNALGADLFHAIAGGTGSFYGSFYQGFGWTGSGSSVLADGSSFGSFDLLFAAYRGTAQLPSNTVDRQWYGYFGGMTGSGSSFNTATGALQLNLNAAAGTVGGRFDQDTGSVFIGADAGLASAYVADSWFFALFPTGTGGSLPFEGVIMPAYPWEQWSSHFIWGWWMTLASDGTAATGFEDWDNYWIAGNPTADLSAKLATLTVSSATGIYQGQARAVLYDGSPELEYNYRKMFGSTKVTVNFGASSFDADLNFSYRGGPSLRYSGSVSSSGLTATGLLINGTPAGSYDLSGSFYGPDLQGLAGFFSAPLGIDSHIAGIYGGEILATAPISVSGRYLAMMTDYDQSMYNEEIWSGAISAQVTMGLIDGNADTLASDGTTAKLFPLSFFSPHMLPSQEQIGAVHGWYHWNPDYLWLGSATRVVNLLGADRVFEYVYFSSPDPAEFSYFFQEYNYVDSYPDYGYFSELGFMGTPSAAISASGLDYYYGDAIMSGYFNGDFNTLFQWGGEVKMGVNWDSGRVFGVIESYGLSHDWPVFFLGRVDKSTGQIYEVKAVGSSIVGAAPYGIQGNGSFGQFYGSGYQGAGGTVAGTFYDFNSPASPIAGDWQMILAGIRDTYSLPAPTRNNLQWQGFVVGLAEDITNPDVGRQIFINNSPSEFHLSINELTGDITGTLMTGALSGTIQMGVEIGGTHGSAYIENDWLIAILGCSTQTCIANASGAGGIKPAGGYLVADDSSSPNEFASWGYWELAYEEPGTGKQYHVHQPGSMWVAGERTPESYVQSLINSQNFTGVYAGTAKAYRIDALDNANNGILEGWTSVTVDFGAQTVTGGFDFTTSSLQLVNGQVSASGFTAQISGATSSQVSGGFFGPQVEGVGGTFGADMPGDGIYMGMFGGNLANGPAP